MSKVVVVNEHSLQKLIRESISKELESIKKGIKEIQNSEKAKLSVNQVAARLDVTPLTVRNYITKGIIKAERIGRRVLICPIELEKALSEFKSLKYKR